MRTTLADFKQKHRQMVETDQESSVERSSTAFGRRYSYSLGQPYLGEVAPLMKATLESELIMQYRWVNIYI